ncbi:interferon-related developmental regulator 1 [Dorcoceras hygrometricum]|uniref:Interferon-related developmental regulator 1 n=1 Tax=Dorcoceras hygrometricum TaxID=472368 RepID=A0A2Z7DCS9_9LAMI|nr:interferon-related developmental regulator 1 [Dorcoceras hygrometricum]
MDRVLDDLLQKRGSTREGALSSIIDSFSVKCRGQFARKNFATLMYRCLNSFKKGSSKEIILASRVLGLLAVTIGCGDNAHELYKESVPIISQAFNSRNETCLLSVIDCLAIITFVGGNDSEETEASMQILWNFINSPIENVVERKKSDSILSATISAWSLLLTTVDGWNLNHNHWRGAITFFMDLLEVEDQSISMSAVEALALICELGCLEKFDSDSYADNMSFINKENNVLDQCSSKQELQEIVSNHAKRLVRLTALDNSAARIMKMNFSWKVLKVLEVKFLKHYLERGFITHMLVVIRVFVPEQRQSDSEDDSPKGHKPSDSALRKAKTRLLNKQRVLKARGRSKLDSSQASLFGSQSKFEPLSKL